MITHRALSPAILLRTADVLRIVRHVGISAAIGGVAARIEQDFRRWPDFEKSARIGSHSPGGVIELMPVADARSFAFK
jgi:ornithine cyclodeaminase